MMTEQSAVPIRVLFDTGACTTLCYARPMTWLAHAVHTKPKDASSMLYGTCVTCCSSQRRSFTLLVVTHIHLLHVNLCTSSLHAALPWQPPPGLNTRQPDPRPCCMYMTVL